MSGLTRKHVSREVSRALGAGQYIPREWFGQRLRITETEHGYEIEFATLPRHIREAFIMQDQIELPL